MESNIRQKQYLRMTTGKISSVVLGLGIPAVIGMLVTAIYNSADTYFVGKLGTAASGGVGIVFSVMGIIQAVGFTVGQGASSIISRKLGEKDYDGANCVASTALLMGLVVSLVIAAAGIIFLDPIMRLLGATEEMLPHSREYAKYILAAAPFMILGFVLNNLLRGEGKIKYAMIGISTGGLLNIALDPLFIHTLSLGTAGAAMATGISQFVSLLILLCAYFNKNFTVVKPRISRISKRASVYADVLKTGLPAMLRQGLASVASIALNRAAVVYGVAAVAAMSIVGKVFMLAFSIALGIGQGYQPVAGYNYGAKKFSRVRKAFRFTLGMSTVVMAVAAAIIYGFAPEIMLLFLKEDPKVVEIGALALRIACIAMPTVPFVVVNNMTFQSTGKALAASVLSSCRQGVFFLIFISVLPGTFGLLGVQMSQAAADVSTLLAAIPMSVVYFKHLPKEDDESAAP